MFPNLFFLLLFLIFIVGVSVEFLWTRRNDREYYNIFDLKNTSLTVFIAAMIDLLLKGIAVFSLIAISEWIPWQLPYNGVTAVLCFVVWDFIFYIKHYLEHRIRLLWAIHICHHNSPFFNLSTSLRSGVFKGLYRYVFYIPIILLGFPPMMFFIVYGLGKLWAYFTHSQKLGEWKWLSPVFVTPATHGVHHASSVDAINKNFGETLIIWDKLFGTYLPKKGDLVYGIVDQTAYNDHSKILFHEFEDLYLDIKRSASFIDALKCLITKPTDTRKVKLKDEKEISKIEFHKLKYKYKEDEIVKILNDRVHTYFTKNNKTRFGNLELFIKIIFIFSMMIGSYVAIVSNYFSPWMTLVFAILFGFSSTMLGFNVAHDAAHHAVSKYKWINNLLARSMSLVGCSSYVWHLRHNLSHHAHCNIPEYDWTTYAHKRILTSSSNPFVRWLSKYPHYYTPFLYCFYFIFLTFYKDFDVFYSSQIGKSCIHHPSKKDHFLFLLSKILYYFIIIILPFILVDLSWWQIVLGYLIMYATSGFIFSIIAIPPHLMEDAVFMQLEDDALHSNRFIHNTETTTDVAINSKVINWIFGGFNTHIIHHLYPNICHVHYIPLTKILKEAMNEHGYHYKETTLIGSIKSHLRFLRKLGD